MKGNTLNPAKDPQFVEKRLRELTTLAEMNKEIHSTMDLDRLLQILVEKAEIGPETARRFGIENGDLAVVETNRGRIRMKVRVAPSVLEGVVFVPHGWPGEANANLLTDAKCREPIMGYPDMKSLMCTIRKAQEIPLSPLS
ncbi:MAG: molybdopterin dinucleotide binding domain-containing protein [Thermodesulfobacteriota bacterium]